MTIIPIQAEHFKVSSSLSVPGASPSSSPFSPRQHQELFSKLVSRKIIDINGVISPKLCSQSLPPIQLKDLEALGKEMQKTFSIKIGDRTATLSMKEILHDLNKDSDVSKILLIGSDAIYELFRIPGYVKQVFELLGIKDLYSDDLMKQDFLPTDIDIRICLTETVEWNKKNLEGKRDALVHSLFPLFSPKKVKEEAFTQLKTFDNGLNHFQIFHLNETDIEIIFSGKLCRKSVFTIDDIAIPFLEREIEPQGHYGNGLQSILDFLFKIVRFSNGFPDGKGWFRLQGLLIKGYQAAQSGLDKRLLESARGFTKKLPSFAAEMYKWVEKHFANHPLGALAYVLQVCQYIPQLQQNVWKQYLPKNLPSRWQCLETFSPQQITLFLPILAYLHGEENRFSIKKYTVSLLLSVEEALMQTFEKHEGEALIRFLTHFAPPKDEENKICEWLSFLLNKNHNKMNVQNIAFLFWKGFQKSMELWQTTEWVPDKIIAYPTLVTRILLTLRESAQYRKDTSQIFSMFTSCIHFLHEKRENFPSIYYNVVLELYRCIINIPYYMHQPEILKCIELLLKAQQVDEAEALLENLPLSNHTKKAKQWDQIATAHLNEWIPNHSLKELPEKKLSDAQDLIYMYVEKKRLTAKGTVFILLRLLKAEIFHHSDSKKTLDFLLPQLNQSLMDAIKSNESVKIVEILTLYLESQKTIKDDFRIHFNRIFPNFLSALEPNRLSVRFVNQLFLHNIILQKKLYFEFWEKVFAYSFSNKSEFLYSVLMHGQALGCLEQINAIRVEKATLFLLRECNDEKTFSLLNIYFSFVSSPSFFDIPLLQRQMKAVFNSEPFSKQFLDWVEKSFKHDRENREYYLELILLICLKIVEKGEDFGNIIKANFILESELFQDLPKKYHKNFHPIVPILVNSLCRKGQRREAFDLLCRLTYFQDINCLLEIISVRGEHLFYMLDTQLFFDEISAFKEVDNITFIYFYLLENVIHLINSKKLQKLISFEKRFDELCAYLQPFSFPHPNLLVSNPSSHSADATQKEIKQYLLDGKLRYQIYNPERGEGGIFSISYEEISLIEDVVVRLRRLEISLLILLIKYEKNQARITKRLSNFIQQYSTKDVWKKVTPLIYHLITQHFSEEFVLSLLAELDLRELSDDQLNWEWIGQLLNYYKKPLATKELILISQINISKSIQKLSSKITKYDIVPLIEYLRWWQKCLFNKYQENFPISGYNRCNSAASSLNCAIEKFNILLHDSKFDDLFEIAITLFISVATIESPYQKAITSTLFKKFFGNMPQQNIEQKNQYIEKFMGILLQVLAEEDMRKKGNYLVLLLEDRLKSLSFLPHWDGLNILYKLMCISRADTVQK